MMSPTLKIAAGLTVFLAGGAYALYAGHAPTKKHFAHRGKDCLTKGLDYIKARAEFWRAEAEAQEG